MKTEKQYKNDIVKKMKAVNTFNKSFQHAIDVFARTLCDYETTVVKFEQLGSLIVIKYTNKNGSTNLVKSPLYLAIEKLRDDILSYSKELGLTPSGLNRLNDELKKKDNRSKLAQVLSELR